MHWIYSKSAENGKIRYQGIKNINLFGITGGYIPFYLENHLKPDKPDPGRWRVDMSRCMSMMSAPDSTIVIDAKPHDAETLSLYELLDVWGYSDHAWTPVMFRLQPLIVDEHKDLYNWCDFHVPLEAVYQPLYSLFYISGGICGGKLTGQWVPPVSRNSKAVMLNDDVFDYFNECRKQ